MLARIGDRWWIPVVCAFPAAFLGLLAAGYVNWNAQPMYIGRTTLMESRIGPGGHYASMRSLSNIASSQAVLSNAAQTLSHLGAKLTLEQLLLATTVVPIKDTDILAIEVTLPAPPYEAKVAADVVAAEFRKEYDRLNGSKSGAGEGMGLKTIDSAFVRKVDDHAVMKLLIGLTGGLVFGILFGLALAVSIPVAGDAARPQRVRGGQIMFAKIRALWWLALVLAFVAGVCFYPLVWSLAAMAHESGKPMYVARTTIKEFLVPPVKGQPDYYEIRLGNLGNLATSQRVLSYAAADLSDIGISPEQVLSGTAIFPIKDTNALAIEVTLPDPKKAKISADVIAAEISKVYAEWHESDARPVPTLRTLTPAFVRKAKAPMPGTSILALLFSPTGGPIIGVVVGLALGLAVATIRSRRKEGRLNV